MKNEQYPTGLINYSYPGGVIRWVDMTKAIALLLFATLLLAPSSITSANQPTIKLNDSYGVAQTAYRIGLDYRLVYAIIKVESNWNPKAKGDDGRSNGLMQVQCPTARAIHPLKKCSDLMKVPVNIAYGMAYLKRQIELYGRKDIKLAIAAYNSGRPIFRGKKLINQDYVTKVMERYRYYREIETTI